MKLRVLLFGLLFPTILPGAIASAWAREPLGLPPLPVPADNAQTPAKIDLGRKLFFDRRLSFNGTMSCAMCHVPEQGFTSNELATPLGMEGRSTRRNAPTLYNVAYHPRLFQDGRERDLELQVWGPLLAPNEMGNPSIGHVVDTIASLADYRSRFEATFQGRRASPETIGRALAAFQRTLVSGGSRFDAWRYGGRKNALTAQEQEGLRLFAGKAGCTACHVIGERSALFSDFGYHNTGVGWMRSQGRARVPVTLGPGLRTELTETEIASFGEPPAADLGRFEITGNPQDRWAYKTPSLRNVALTAPYMHDGSLATLEAVVEYYDAGGAGAPDQSPLVRPLQLTSAEKYALVAFLRALTGDNVSRLAKLAAPR
jgi:cytochrome c peroxidase